MNPRPFIAVFLFLFTIIQASGQSYGNEWIQYGQQYFRFKVPEDGIYRIDRSTLSANGIPVASLDPRNIQVFGREREVAIHIAGEQDGSFDPGDFIEFYGRANDGWLDSLSYPDPKDQTDPYYSLYNDTATYYLTWNSNLANKRAEPETDTDFGSYPRPDHLWKKTVKSYHRNYEFGFKDRFGGTSPRYTAGEGWVGRKFRKGKTQSRELQTAQAYQAPGAPDAKVTGAVASVSDPGVGPNHHLQVLTPKGKAVVDTTYTGYKLIQYEFEVPNSQIGSPTTDIRHRSVDDLGAKTDFQAVSYLTFTYPHTGNAEGGSRFRFQVPHAPNSEKAHVRLKNLSGNQFVMYRLNGEVKRIRVVSGGNGHEALVPHLSSGERARCFISATSAIRSIEELEPVSDDGYFTDFGEKARDSAFVIISHEKLWNAAQDYADHREKRFNSLLVDVEELYHQFGGGIRKGGIALHRFAKFLHNEWPESPHYLFLLGKYIRMEDEGSPGARQHEGHFNRLLVPSYGYPPSDNLITAGMGNAVSLEPAIPVGRLAATTPDEVRDYLDKVKQHESLQGPSNQPKEWMKRILHFGGGNTANQQKSFAQFLAHYESIIQDTSFGGQVHTFLKTSSDPIQIGVSDSVTDLIENGVSMMTFFGHASGGGFDQNIDHPSNYDNEGKYPIILANACFSGDIHRPSTNSTSEEFVLIEDRGMLGFIATVKLGYASALNNFSKEFYKNLGYRKYGETLGQVFRGTLADFQKEAGNSFLNELTALEMTLHGDPAVKVHTQPKPEFKISDPSVFFTPKDITAREDSFTVNVAVTNLGKAVPDSFEVRLIRDFPGTDEDSIHSRDMGQLHFKDTIRFTLPVQPEIANGLNEFDVFVDHPSDRVEEAIDEFNNNKVLNKGLLIRTDGIIPVHPYEYAIIPDEDVTLKASTGDPFSGSREYLFEIDTTDRFNSPLKRKTVVAHKGGVVTWEPDMSMTDSTVYFWRVSPNASDPSDLQWRESSFQYIPGRRGWGQSHFFQFKKDGFNQIEYDRPNREFKFFSGKQSVLCKVYGNPSGSQELNSTLWKKGFQLQEYGGCSFAPSIHVAVIDPVTLESWGSYGTNPQGALVNEDHQFGNANNYPGCRKRTEKYFIYRQNNDQSMAHLENLLRDTVPDGHYVLVYTWIYAQYDGWSNTNLTDWFQSQGADSIGKGQDRVPFIFFVKKGNPATAEEVYGTRPDDFITLNASIQGSKNAGFITSEKAGPSAEWDALYWEDRPLEQNSADSTAIQVIGIDQKGNEAEVASFPAEKDSVPNLEQHVDASEYPYVKLRARLKDSANATPAQMKRWQLLHRPKPEAAIDPSQGYVFRSDTLQEGQQLEVSIPVENISAYPMDSLLVSYWIEDRNHVDHVLDYPRQDSLLSGEVLRDTLDIETRGFPGSNRLWMEVNPLDSATGTYDQLEKHHFNNIASLNFHTRADRINPILDVTFDGRHIMNGDIVSTNPKIHISLDDENEHLWMDEAADTANFKVWLTDPDGNERRVYFRDGQGNPIMKWFPAKSAENVFRIEYTPELEKNGEYNLLVQAMDKSGNESGDIHYEIDFKVVQKSTVTNVLNYPNPFSSRTQFVFTLTGSEPPEHFKIRIMTVTGKVVRELTKRELGPLHIGVNRTDYWWDGTDKYGDPLGNGVYLYQVIAKDGGKNVEHRKTSADQYFEEGFGKMYLMR